MPEPGYIGPGEPRSSGAIPQRRVPQAWPKDRRFRILSIDGGGIRGIFPAAILAGLEHTHTAGHPIASYFDLIAGTSTGGILALGLGAGLTAEQLLNLYIHRGGEVFPPFSRSLLGRVRSWIQHKRHIARYLYSRSTLEQILKEYFDDMILGDSSSRLCIPAFEGRHSEVFLYKTPHHPDYKIDRYERMVTVGLATAAAPSYFRPLEHDGYTLVDGGVWANNPIMLSVIEALTCFDIERDQIDVLSIGCGDDRYVVSQRQITKGGLWHWKTIMEGAMRLQSLAATNQARLLLGPPAVLRIDAPSFEPKLDMDDWRRARDLLPAAAASALHEHQESIASIFLRSAAERYKPHPIV
jgi:patatin-like phospholipase/acyl hydrolase